MPERIRYELNAPITVEQFREVLDACTLGARRPVHDAVRLQRMLDHSNLLVTAWEGASLAGISRCFSDFAFVTYCSDLAVKESHQRLGIGKELLRRTLTAGGCRIVLLAAPAAEEYYPRIGFQKHNSAWTILPGELD